MLKINMVEQESELMILLLKMDLELNISIHLNIFGPLQIKMTLKKLMFLGVIFYVKEHMIWLDINYGIIHMSHLQQLFLIVLVLLDFHHRGLDTSMELKFMIQG